MSNQKIVVKNNAPGWPAMVSNKFTADKKAIKDKIKAMKENEHMSNFNTARTNDTNSSSHNNSIARATPDESTTATSIWLQKRYNKIKSDSTEPIPATTTKSSPFAPKIVRQCAHCQVLYTSFHKCQEDNKTETFEPRRFN